MPNDSYIRKIGLKMTERTLTKLEQAAIEYFNLDYAESDEPDAGWFCYTDCFNLHPEYPGSSCECLHDVVEWYLAAQQKNTADLCCCGAPAVDQGWCKDCAPYAAEG